MNKIHHVSDSISSLIFDVPNSQQESIFEVGVPL